MIFIVLALLAVGLVAWLAFELWRVPLCCNRTELPVDQCPCCQGKEGREEGVQLFHGYILPSPAP